MNDYKSLRSLNLSGLQNKCLRMMSKCSWIKKCVVIIIAELEESVSELVDNLVIARGEE